MPRVALTDRFCSTAKPLGVRTEYFDATITGLALRVTKQGHRSWTFNFTASRDGKRARATIGTYPGTTLAEARTRALEARACLERGEDPRVEFSSQSAGAMTVSTLLESYLAKHARVNLRSHAEIERRLLKNVVPVIGSVRIADIHKRDVNRVVDAIVRRGKMSEANRVFEDLRGVLRWGLARGDLDRNPIHGMTKPGTAAPRERVLSDEEVRALWALLPVALRRSSAVQRIIRLCLVTGQRVGEVAGMRTAELDLRTSTWSLSGARTKNGYPHLVPLSGLAVSIINEALAEEEKRADAVFPAEGGSLSGAAVARTISRAHETTKDRPLGRFGIAQWSAHDLRRTALTGMAKLGVAPIVLGHVANHRTTTKAGVTLGVYVQHSYEGEKRAALELWAERLEAIVSAEFAAEIVPFTRARP